ncbi:MAG: cysteine hydrolase [Chloroflexi bacterium]|nr:cysteine hydrolase [Chloroflexota bacterium]
MFEIHGVTVLDTIEEIAEPKHTAVLVIDMQNDNASPKGFQAMSGRDISYSRKIVPNIKRVLDKARSMGLPVIFLKNGWSKDGSLESGPIMRQRAKMPHMKNLLQEYTVEGTWGWEVLDELEPRPEERQFGKYRSSAFIGTPLDLLLRNRNIKSVVSVGVATHGCVESTVRDLAHYGYYPIVLSDCVAGPHPKLHDAALTVMAARYDTITSDELIKLWDKLGAKR